MFNFHRICFSSFTPNSYSTNDEDGLVYTTVSRDHLQLFFISAFFSLSRLLRFSSFPFFYYLFTHASTFFGHKSAFCEMLKCVVFSAVPSIDRHHSRIIQPLGHCQCCCYAEPTTANRRCLSMRKEFYKNENSTVFDRLLCCIVVVACAVCLCSSSLVFTIFSSIHRLNFCR